MQKIIGTGLSGLVGSRVVDLLGQKYEFEDISRKTGTDITDEYAVLDRIKKSESKIVLHLAAYTNVDEAEKQKNLNKESDSWKINVLGTANVISACEQTGKHLFHVSTDMVFSGTKPLPERYSEEDPTGPIGWYASTKGEAEKLVKSSKAPWTIIRVAYPYLANNQKKSYVFIFKSLLEQGKSIQAVTDHFFTPSFIDDVTQVLNLLLQEKLTGIFHAGGKDIVSPYEVAQKVAGVFNLDKNLITKTTREEYFKGKAPRGFNLSLNSDKIEALGVRMRGFEEGLAVVKEQM